MSFDQRSDAEKRAEVERFAKAIEPRLTIGTACRCMRAGLTAGGTWCMCPSPPPDAPEES